MKLTTLIFALLLLSWTAPVQAVSFTDFHVNPNSAAGATNTNAGSTSTGAFVYKSIATTAGGTWSGTVFTPNDGSVPANTVSAGMFASIYTNGINTNAVFVARINTVAAGPNGAITIDAVAKSGTAPTAVAGSVAAITIAVGGTWRGPYEGGSTSVTFPFNFVGPNMTNSAGNMVCVNIIGGTNYTVTNAITHSVNGPIRWEGYTNTAHDGGQATISGGTTVASFVLFTASGNHNDYNNLRFLNNGATGVADGVAASGAGNMYHRCTWTGMRGSGVNVTAIGLFVECEGSTNNVANTQNKANFENVIANQVYLRCVAHDSTNINASGFHCSQAATLIDCITSNTGSNGVTFATTGDPIIIINSDFNKARLSGFVMSSVPAVSQLAYIENSNFITNGQFGVEGALGSIYKRNGAFYNLGLGSGTATNASTGVSTNMGNVFTNGFVTYPSGTVPWVNSINGNFRINIGPAQNTGRGSFTLTSAGYTNTISYIDIGAAQHISVTNASSGGVFAQ